MGWFYSLVRVAGAGFPVSASLVQLQGEIDAQEMKARLDRLEDPISSLVGGLLEQWAFAGGGGVVGRLAARGARRWGRGLLSAPMGQQCRASHH